MEYTRVEETFSEVEALTAVPENIAIRNGMIPIACEEDRLMVLINSPQARERLKDVGILLGKEIHALLTSCEDIEEEIAARYQALKEGNIEEITIDPLPGWSDQQKEEAEAEGMSLDLEAVEEINPAARFEEIAQAAAGASVVQMVSTIIEGAVNSGATDIHIDPHDPESRVRYRIDGVLHDVMSVPQQQHPAIVSRIKIISDLDITETRHPQDGHISIELGQKEYDVRVATLPTYLGERVVLRLLDQSTVLSGLRDLGLNTQDEIKMRRIISQPYGMILVTGPTGSGKTTTLYAALNQKDVMTESIVTLEDPVEYQLPGINQVQIDTDINLTFASTLRAALRQDIDVLLVGEIRDPETAQIAVRAAMTGHLVFSTLHTNDAIEAISTLRNMSVPPFLIAAALTAVIGQRLVRKICPGCRQEFIPEKSLLKSLAVSESTKTLYRSKGCQACHFTGHSGRTGVFEVMEISPEIREEIINESSAEKINKIAAYTSLAEHCRQKVLDGVVNPEEYLRVIRI
jgi:type IV pilus assembly protein PilB